MNYSKEKSAIVNKSIIGNGSKIWHYANVYGCEIGENCIIGSFTEIQNNVIIGDRAAVNFQGLDADKIHRGCQLVSPGYFLSTKQIGAFIKTLNSIKKPITQNQRIRIHIGTQEVMARISLVEMGKLLPGETSTAFLKLESPITASIGDKFIIRSYSPISTIAGGEIIDNEVSGKWAAIKTFLIKVWIF